MITNNLDISYLGKGKKYPYLLVYLTKGTTALVYCRTASELERAITISHMNKATIRDTIRVYTDSEVLTLHEWIQKQTPPADNRF